ncbi:WG repeat-containing protein [Fluviicola taffensis]|uniref:KWG Leptospira repeat protein n=1 Tax=Fluviicola taffensis (strain DSM 16823 / NCIMB 13979 / RW262) TaxID=755732 RepID=F2IH79_FLUTR|nr:WG repeat-containing protein [Fluviicola taffensis]AEA42634.1 hypothetical protein Fluta_0630 [Fluviicola taffensis DSM 16823]
MKQNLLPILLIAFACTTSHPEKHEVAIKDNSYSDIVPIKDTLYSTSAGEFEYGTSYGYTNKFGDTIIPVGEFEYCFSDLFATFAYVSDKKFKDKGIVAINRNKELIFEAFIYDNGPDYINEGLFRIKRNGKIGFADLTGKVVIDAKYGCAYPFENGKAKVSLDCETIQDGEHSSWESDNWFYIDKKGNKIK